MKACRRAVVALLVLVFQMPVLAWLSSRASTSRTSVRRIWRTRTKSAVFSTLRTPNDQEQFERNYKELMDASTLSLAPMMEYTDRHFRHLVRLISSRTLLYTEMVAANAIAHERDDSIQAYQEAHPNADVATVRANYKDDYLQRFLAQGSVEPLEGPSVLQLGGSDPEQLHQAVETVMELTARGHCRYTAINLNCGCPSPKVAGKGCFGAALMDEPALVADLTQAIHDGCQGRLPVTVKCRIGTDTQRAFSKATADQDNELEYQELCRFIETVASKGIVTDFGVHARIAVLRKSFSPSDNRKVPPLKYQMVHRLVQDYPDLTFTLNGGVETLSQVQHELAESPGLKGVMVGRAWAADPWSFAMADQLLYDDTTNTNVPQHRLAILEAYGKHADAEERKGDPTRIRRFLIKAVTPLFASEPNAKRYRIALNDIAGIPKQLAATGKSLDSQPPLSELILAAAVEHLSPETLYRSPQESYERGLWEEERRHSAGLRSQAVDEWQVQRKADAASETQDVGDAATKLTL